MRRERRRGFTLVELLVVIGILAVLVGILLPALSKARQAGLTIKCAANLHSIGQAIAVYVADNNGTFPAAYMYAGQTMSNEIDNAGGYINWSSVIMKIAGNDDPTAPNNIYLSTRSWEMFQCPALESGGLPPTDTWGTKGEGNHDSGQESVHPDTATSLDQPHSIGAIDQQAPRLAYTVNEALMPRNKFWVGFKGGDPVTSRAEHFVKFSQVKFPNHVVLATEFYWDWHVVSDATINADAGTLPPCKSHRPVHAYITASGNLNMNELPTAGGGFGRQLQVATRAKPSDLTLSPKLGDAILTRLDWVGRNHGSDAKTAKTNFLYADGHLETKRIEDTLSPNFEWGQEFYSMSGNDGDIEHNFDGAY
jgi:prepilin-type N-terminal cleavage/methylation domain-containing protein/prepilin-type processing-associated H-X9-DG protein